MTSPLEEIPNVNNPAFFAQAGKRQMKSKVQISNTPDSED